MVQWTDEQRHHLITQGDAAKACLEEVIGDVEIFMEILECNRLPLIDNCFSEQVPESRGALAYNRWRRSMREHEIIRLCALWEYDRHDSVSVPALSSTLTKGALKLLRHELECNLILASNDPVSVAKGRIEDCQLASETISAFKGHDDFKMLKEARNEYIAHRRTRVARKAARARHEIEPIVDETLVERVFERAVQAASRIEGAFRPSVTDWLRLRRHYRRNGEALWKNLRLNIAE